MRSLENEDAFSIELRYEKLSVIADKRTFKVCEIKEKEIGLVRKKFLYVHFDGRQWNILKIDVSSSTIARYTLK